MILGCKQIKYFCSTQNIIPKKKSKTTLYLALSLLGLGVYSQYKRQNAYMSNLFLNPQQFEKLKKSKSIEIDKQEYILHPSNKSIIGEKVVIIGAGIIGVSQALKLLQHGYEVIIIEKEQYAATKCSAFNGNVYNPYLFNPLVSKYSIQTMIKNYINPTENATQRFSFGSLFEFHGFMWLINALILSTQDQQFNKSINDMTQLGNIQEQEFQEFKKLGILNPQYSFTADGELSLYKSIDYGKRISNGFNEAGIIHQEVNQTQYSNHPINKQLFEQFPYVIKLDKENNLDTKILTLNILKYCQQNYPTKFNIYYGTETNQFVLGYDRNVLGINTNKGIFFGNKFIICAGLHSKYLASKLAVNLPIMPCRGWVIEANLPQEAKGSLLDTTVLKLPTLTVTNLNGKLRISGCQLLDKEYKSDEPLQEWGAQILIKQMKDIFNIDLDQTELTVRDCCRPLTPDDKIILGRLDLNRNVFVNAGHGSRGMSQSLGCAEIIYQIMKGKDDKYKAFDIYRFLFV